MVSRRYFWSALLLVGCANIWGFDDLKQKPPPPPPLVCLSIDPCDEGCTSCSLRCVDLKTDELNCGSCGTQCTGGRSCEAGACVCGTGEPCGGLCVDVTSDPMNCGGCAIVCDMGGACNDGTCTFPVTLSTGQGAPGGIVEDATRLYFVGGTAIYSMGKDGSDLVTLTGAATAVPIAIDADNLYYGGLSINVIPLVGGTPTMLTPLTQSAGAVAVDSTDVYWVDSSSVNKIAVSGGSPVVLTTGTVSATTIAVDPTGVYFSYSYNVYRTPLDGGSMTLMGATSSTVQDLALDATSIYVASAGIMSFALDGSASRSLAPSSATRLAIDADNVYFWSGTSLNRVSKRGGDVTTLATDMYPAGDLAVDETNVYWTSRGVDGITGAVMMVAK